MQNLHTTYPRVFTDTVIQHLLLTVLLPIELCPFEFDEALLCGAHYTHRNSKFGDPFSGARATFEVGLSKKIEMDNNHFLSLFQLDLTSLKHSQKT